MLNFNQKGRSGSLLVGLLAVIILIGLFYSFSLKRVEIESDQILEDSGISLDATNNIYLEALKKAKELVIVPVRHIDENDDKVMGEASAQAELIVYTDFTCEFCLDYSVVLKKLMEDYGDNLHLSYRHFFINANDDSLDAANAAECAREQGKFWEMYDKLFEDNFEGSLFADEYKLDAEELGLDTSAFNKCLDEKRYDEKIVDEILEAKTFGVNGTPTSFLNGQVIPGARPYEDYTDVDGEEVKGLKSLIEEEISKM